MMRIHLSIYSYRGEEVDISEGEVILYKVVDKFTVQCDENEENIRRDWTLNIRHPVTKKRMLLDIFEVEKTDKGWDCAVIPTEESRKEYRLQ